MKWTVKILGLGAAFAAGLLLGSPALDAQDVAYDRELWSLERAYNAAIMEGDAEKQATFWHSDYHEWVSTEDRPWDRRFGLKLVNEFYGSDSNKLGYPMLEPLAARVLDDVGMTYSRLEYTAESAEGETSQRVCRVTHFWVKTEGEWKIFGGVTDAE